MFFVFTHKVLPRAGGGRNISDEIGRRHGSRIIIALKDVYKRQLPIKVYTALKTGVTPEINALCTLMLAVTILLVVISGAVGRMRGGAQQTQEGKQ